MQREACASAAETTTSTRCPGPHCSDQLHLDLSLSAAGSLLARLVPETSFLSLSSPPVAVVCCCRLPPASTGACEATFQPRGSQPGSLPLLLDHVFSLPQAACGLQRPPLMEQRGRQVISSLAAASALKLSHPATGHPLASWMPKRPHPQQQRRRATPSRCWATCVRAQGTGMTWRVCCRGCSA